MSMLCVDKDIKAAVFDVDGTLYDYRNGCVPHSAIDAVARLKEKGYFIIVATGRTMAMLNPQITEELAPDYYILSNGALVSDRNSLIFFSNPFSRKETDLLVDLTNAYGGAMILKYQNENCIYFDYEAGRKLWDVGPGMVEEQTFFDEKHKTHNRKLPIGISIYGDGELKQEIQRFFTVDEFKDAHGIDVMREGVHKMAGLKRLLKGLGLGPENIIAFGDSGNDVEMITQAAIGVAMGNGKKELQQAADYVSPCSWEDGIAEALHTLQQI